MIDKSTLIAWLREFDYSFKRAGKRADLWKRPGSTHRLSVPRTQKIRVSQAKEILVQAGMAPEDAARRIEAATK